MPPPRASEPPVALPHRDQLRGYLWQNDYHLGAHRSAALERRETISTTPALDAWAPRWIAAARRDALALGYGFNAGGHRCRLNV